VVDDAERLIGFLAEVFGAVEQGRSLRPDGRIDHGDVRIGDSLVMLSEASQQYPARPCVHAVLGRRTCGFVDPFDNRWWVATHQREFS
jgi:PhnB protein